jgi:hypothetical protein
LCTYKRQIGGLRCTSRLVLTDEHRDSCTINKFEKPAMVTVAGFDMAASLLVLQIRHSALWHAAAHGESHHNLEKLAL